MEINKLYYEIIMVFSAPFQNIRLPPPPGFIPPPVPPRPTVISVSNPFSAVVTKPSPNYKINTNNNDLQTTKSILREPGVYSVKNVSDRVVSFDLESSATITTNTTMTTKPIINHAQGSLAPKCSNPSMPNLHYGCEKVSQKKSKNPFLTGFLTGISDANDSEHESCESQSDDDDFDDFESAENTDLVLSDTTNISHNNNKTVKLGENFFASLFNNTSFTNKIPDPWSATKSTEAKAAATSVNATAWPTMTTASGTPAGQPQPGPHGLSPMTPANPSATQKSPTGSGVPGSQNRPAESTAASVSVADRYSALKELDEIFKTTVTVSDGEFFFYKYLRKIARFRTRSDTN
jgi:hypothetical protein